MFLSNAWLEVEYSIQSESRGYRRVVDVFQVVVRSPHQLFSLREFIIAILVQTILLIVRVG